MTVLQALLAFTAAAALLTVTPGLDTALVLRTAASGGARRAAAAALRIGLGCLTWGAVAAVGLGALLAAPAPAFTLLKWAGSAYLLWLGLHMLLRPRAGLVLDGIGPADGSSAAVRRGLLTNLLNPKVGVFYVSFLPQFLPGGVNPVGFAFLLAAIHVALSLLWFAALIAATARLGCWLRRPPVVQALDRLTGVVFIGFGVRLALTRA